MYVYPALSICHSLSILSSSNLYLIMLFSVQTFSLSSTSVFLSIFLFICLTADISVSLSACMYVHCNFLTQSLEILFFPLFHSLSIYRFIYLTISLYTHLSIFFLSHLNPFVYLFLSMYLTICIYLFFCLSGNVSTLLNLFL